MSDDKDGDDESTGAMSHVLGSARPGSGAVAVAAPSSRQSQRSSFLSLMSRDELASSEGPARHRNGTLLATVEASGAGGSSAPLPLPPLPLPFRHGPLLSNDSRTSLRASSPVSASERTDRTTGSSPGGSGASARVELALRRKCCAKRCRKLSAGVLVTCCVAASWVYATHFVKCTYRTESTVSTPNSSLATNLPPFTKQPVTYHAPFFTTWFCTLWTGLFFPLYLVARMMSCCERSSLQSVCKESIGTFREKGFTATKFFGRCGLFCLLWVITNYMYIHALRILDATDVMALYSSNVSFVYLLSWVVLHEQFVGVRIVAVILCSTGIALLAYMDGLMKTPTLGGVLLGAASSAGSAVYKVMFKKLFGDANFGEVALFFTLIGSFSTLLLWPILTLLYFTGAEIVTWERIPWKELTGAAGLSLVTNLLGNFGIAITYEIFITLGLVVAVPLSAAMDIHYYSVKFAGMKLSGIILIAVGFFLALFPENWPDYLTKVIRWRRHRTPREEPSRQEGSSATRSRLRSSTGLIK